jgi:hypothetical protein
MQMDRPMAEFDLDSPDESSIAIRPDGTQVRVCSESQCWRNIFRSLHRARKEGKVIRPPNAELLERWKQEDLQPGSDGSESWASKIAKGRPN